MSRTGTFETRGGDVSVETPTAADLPAIARVYYAARIATMTWLDPSRFNVSDFASHAAGEDVLVARSPNGEVVGFISVWSPDDFIHMLYVDPTSQGRGAGTALLHALPGWPHRRYRLKCLVHNVRAKAFYERHGFAVTGWGESEEGAYDEMTFPTLAKN